MKMKRLFLAAFFGIVMVFVMAAQSLVGRTMYVTVEVLELKSSAAFFSNSQGILVYGDVVKVLRERGKWVEVQASSRPNLQGWISATSLTTRRVIRAGESSSVSASELALAGKGFNLDVENSYKQRNNVNYAALDVLDAERISSQDLLLFLREGHLERGDR